MSEKERHIYLTRWTNLSTFQVSNCVTSTIFLVCCEIYDSESLSMMKNHASDLNSFSIEQKNSS